MLLQVVKDSKLSISFRDLSFTYFSSEVGHFLSPNQLRRKKQSNVSSFNGWMSARSRKNYQQFIYKIYILVSIQSILFTVLKYNYLVKPDCNLLFIMLNIYLEKACCRLYYTLNYELLSKIDLSHLVRISTVQFLFKKFIIVTAA